MRPLLGDKKVRQKPSHSRLLRKVAEPLTTRPSKLDAIVVPAARPASFVGGLIDLSVRLGTLLVVLCSMQTRVDRVAARVAQTPGARALLIEVPPGFRIPAMPARTSAGRFTEANGGRTSDLSTKRNLGLLLARLNGWSKIAFLDDDITLSHTSAYQRLARQLDHSQIAGMICREFPDNSVVCHARRLAMLPQDNFVSGSVLGVRCGDITLPFFPDIYNEDWFFFSKAVAQHGLMSAGAATQAPYEPFAKPQRATHEEFGDLLAEGLYSLIEDIGDRHLPYGRILGCADTKYWTAFISARHENLQATRQRLEDYGAHIDGDCEPDAALRSLAAAEHQLGTIRADRCAEFLDAWQRDLADWETLCLSTDDVGSVPEAMRWFSELPWRMAQFGDTHVNGSAVQPSGLDLPAEANLVPLAG